MNHGGYPQILQDLLSPIYKQLTLPQRKHLRWFLFGVLITVKNSKLLHIARVAPQGGHRTSCGRFLQSNWNSVSLMQAKTINTLKWMKPQKEEPLYFIIDDTKIEKRGKKMEAVSKIYDHKSQRFIHGHIVVTAAVLFRGVMLPWQFKLWIPKDQAGGGYHKLTRIAAEMINAFQLPWELKVRVLFDAFYLSPSVVKACENSGFTWFSVAAKNRNMKRRYCQKRSIKDFAAGQLRHEGKRVRLRRSRGWRWMRIASVDGVLGRVGLVRMVLSKRPADPWKKTLAVVTNETKLAARAIMVIYEKRWHIEMLFKELRSSLGFCDYQVLSRHAIERHLHLCGMVHQLLTHHSLMDVGAQARGNDREVVLPRLTERLDKLRMDVRSQQAKLMLSKIQSKKARSNIRAFLQNELQIVV